MDMDISLELIVGFCIAFRREIKGDPEAQGTYKRFIAKYGLEDIGIENGYIALVESLSSIAEMIYGDDSAENIIKLCQPFTDKYIVLFDEDEDKLDRGVH